MGENNNNDMDSEMFIPTRKSFNRIHIKRIKPAWRNTSPFLLMTARNDENTSTFRFPDVDKYTSFLPINKISQEYYAICM